MNDETKGLKYLIGPKLPDEPTACPACATALIFVPEVSHDGPLEWCGYCPNEACPRTEVSPYEVL